MKAVFVDIDGTLTAPGTNTAPPSAVEAIARARRAGHKVFLCTGRNYAMLAPLLPYGFDGYVGSAGGYVVCGDRLLYDHPMSDALRREATGLLRAGGCLVTVEARDGCWCDEGVAGLLRRVNHGGSEALRWRRAMEEELHIRPMAEYRGQRAYKLIFYCERPEQYLPARRALEGRFRFVVQDSLGMGCVTGELINRAFHKGEGVRRIAGELGIPLADTVGFGDSMNDYEMLKTVGFGVCMGGSCRELREVSKLVCGTLEEDGLARAFETLGLF